MSHRIASTCLAAILIVSTTALVGCQGFNVQASGNGSGARVRVNAPGFDLAVDADQSRGVRVSANGRDFAFDLDGRTDGRVRARARGRDFDIDARSDGNRTLVRGQADGRPIRIDVAGLRQQSQNQGYPYAREEAMTNQALLERINAHRRSLELGELRLDEELCRRARLAAERDAREKEIAGTQETDQQQQQQQQQGELRYAARFPYRSPEVTDVLDLGKRRAEDPRELAEIFASLYAKDAESVLNDPNLKSVGLATTIQGDGRFAYNDFRYRLEG